MSQRFGPAAARLAGQAGALFGWSADQFWRATPEELASLLTAAAPAPAEGVTRADLAALITRDADGAAE